MQNDEIVEDPDNEFGSSEAPVREGPRIINVGIPGPGAHVPLWKRAWRDKIIPAVARFNPDIILISAGFDAHKKDDINFRYLIKHIPHPRVSVSAHKAALLCAKALTLYSPQTCSRRMLRGCRASLKSNKCCPQVV